MDSTKNKKLTVFFTDPRDSAQESIKKELKIHREIIYAIVAIVATGFITIVISAFAIFIDHYNFKIEQNKQLIQQCQNNNNPNSNTKQNQIKPKNKTQSNKHKQ